MTSEAVTATLSAHGEATIDLIQYVLFSIRRSECMCYCEGVVKPRLTLSFICASWSIGVIAAACFEHAFDVGVHGKDSSAEDSMGCPRNASFQGCSFPEA